LNFLCVLALGVAAWPTADSGPAPEADHGWRQPLIGTAFEVIAQLPHQRLRPYEGLWCLPPETPAPPYYDFLFQPKPRHCCRHCIRPDNAGRIDFRSPCRVGFATPDSNGNIGPDALRPILGVPDTDPRARAINTPYVNNLMTSIPVDSLFSVFGGTANAQTRQDAVRTLALIGATSAIRAFQRDGDGEGRGGVRGVATFAADILHQDDDPMVPAYKRLPLYLTFGFDY
jgi:hypothetical protein